MIWAGLTATRLSVAIRGRTLVAPMKEMHRIQDRRNMGMTQDSPSEPCKSCHSRLKQNILNNLSG